jgi:hypothetical protein
MAEGFTAFNKESLFKLLPVEEKGKYNMTFILP